MPSDTPLILPERERVLMSPFFFFFLRATPMAYGISWARGQSELQLLAYTTATATWDQSPMPMTYTIAQRNNLSLAH